MTTIPKLKDLTGQTFNRLTVMKRDTTRKGVYWRCRCECGNVVSVQAHNLTSGQTKSCGCLNDELIHRKRRNSKDLSGQKFGQIKVLKYAGSDQNGTLWECKCNNCGSITVIPAAWLKGRKSCGCLAKASAIKNTEKLHNINKRSGSNVSILRKNANSNNVTTGVRGVCYIKSKGLYVAYITYRRVRYTLLQSTNLDKCIKIRKEAEEAIRSDFLKWFDEYNKEKEI